MVGWRGSGASDTVAMQGHARPYNYVLITVCIMVHARRLPLVYSRWAIMQRHLVHYKLTLPSDLRILFVGPYQWRLRLHCIIVSLGLITPLTCPRPTHVQAKGGRPRFHQDHWQVFDAPFFYHSIVHFLKLYSSLLPCNTPSTRSTDRNLKKIIAARVSIFQDHLHKETFCHDLGVIML
jgi:hypothetical protein